MMPLFQPHRSPHAPGQNHPGNHVGAGHAPNADQRDPSGNGTIRCAVHQYSRRDLYGADVDEPDFAMADWTVAGTATNIAPGLFEFTSPASPMTGSAFIAVRSP